MDDKDRLLLTILEDNSRLPLWEMADLVDLDEAEVRDRIARLEDIEVIKNYHAVIDWEKVGDGEVSALIELKVSPERDVGYDKIAMRIARFPQVRNLRLISGVYDLQLLVTGKNIQEITRFVAEQIAPMDHIRETATILIMKTYKENGRFFFEREKSERLPLSF